MNATSRRRLPLLVRVPLALTCATGSILTGTVAVIALIAATAGEAPGWLDRDSPIDFLYRHPLLWDSSGGLVTYAVFMVAGMVGLFLAVSAINLLTPRKVDLAAE